MDWDEMESSLRKQWRELKTARKAAIALGLIGAERELAEAINRVAVAWDAIAEAALGETEGDTWGRQGRQGRHLGETPGETEETGETPGETGGDTWGDRGETPGGDSQDVDVSRETEEEETGGRQGETPGETPGETGGDSRGDSWGDRGRQGETGGDSRGRQGETARRPLLSLATSNGNLVDAEDDNRTRIITMKREGDSIRVISRKLGISKGAVEYALGKRKKSEPKLGSMLKGIADRLKSD